MFKAAQVISDGSFPYTDIEREYRLGLGIQ